MEAHGDMVPVTLQQFFSSPLAKYPEYATVSGIKNRHWICALIYFYLRRPIRYVPFASKQWNAVIIWLKNFLFFFRLETQWIPKYEHSLFCYDKRSNGIRFKITGIYSQLMYNCFVRTTNVSWPSSFGAHTLPHSPLNVVQKCMS